MDSLAEEQTPVLAKLRSRTIPCLRIVAVVTVSTPALGGPRGNWGCWCKGLGIPGADPCRSCVFTAVDKTVLIHHPTRTQTNVINAGACPERGK